MTDYRAILTRLHQALALDWDQMPIALVREVREALEDKTAPDGLDLTPILHRWGPGPLWEVCTEDGDVDGYVRALCYEDARQAAADMGCDGDYTVAECHEAPRAERLKHAANDIAALLTEVTRLRLLASTPSPTPTVDSGAEPARGEGASARACWDCRHDSIGDGRGVCLLTGGGGRSIVSDWIRANSTFTEPAPGARNCPGWAPREAGEVSHE